MITGGAGFVGSNLAVSLASRHPEWEVVALDNLYRRGSELNLPRLEAAGVEFVKGDVREPGDLERFDSLDALIECSAEPSVMSGVDGDTSYLVHTNLTGAYNCLEQARRAGAFVPLPLDQPRLSGGAAGRSEAGGGRDALRDRSLSRPFRAFLPLASPRTSR